MVRYGKHRKAALDRMTDKELYHAVERGSFVDPGIIAYCKKHRPHVLMDRMLDHKWNGGPVGTPGQKWMEEAAQFAYDNLK